MNNYVEYKNVKKVYRDKSNLLSNIGKDIDNLKKSDDPFLKRYLEISSFLSSVGLSVDLAFGMDDEKYTALAEEAKKLVEMSSLVRQFVALKEYGRILIHETRNLEDVLMQLEASSEKEKTNV